MNSNNFIGILLVTILLTSCNSETSDTAIKTINKGGDFIEKSLERKFCFPQKIIQIFTDNFPKETMEKFSDGCVEAIDLPYVTKRHFKLMQNVMSEKQLNEMLEFASKTLNVDKLAEFESYLPDLKGTSLNGVVDQIKDQISGKGNRNINDPGF